MASSDAPPIRFCAMPNGARIAYAVAGDGPPLVWVAPFFTHIELEWKHPALRAFFGRLATEHTIVRYDPYGCGLSDRSRTDFTLDADVAALSAVLDHLGLERVALLGPSGGGAPAVAFAARHPTRVTHLILYATAVTRGPSELGDAMRALIRANWALGSKALATLKLEGEAPDAAAWHADVQCAAATPEMAAELMALRRRVDLRPLLPKVTAPTLVVHRRGDPYVPFAASRDAAASIVGARLVPLDGNNHLPFFGDSTSVIETILAFLREPAPAPAMSARLTTREREVLRYLGQGCANREIAAKLDVSIRTVERHLLNIYGKLNARGRADAIAYAIRHRAR